MLAHSLRTFVSIPLKLPPASLQPKPLAVQKPLSVPHGRVTIVADAAAGDAGCNTPAESEEVEPKAVDLGQDKGTVDTEESQCGSDQQQELPPPDVPVA